MKFEVKNFQRKMEFLNLKSNYYVSDMIFMIENIILYLLSFDLLSLSLTFTSLPKSIMVFFFFKLLSWVKEALTTAASLFLLIFLKHSEKNPNYVVMMEDTFQDHFQIKEGQKYFCQPNESLKEFFFFSSSLSQSYYLKTLCFIVLAGPIKKNNCRKI